MTSLTGEMAGQERQRMLLLHCHPLLLLLIKVSFSPPALMEETLRDEIQRISKTPWTNRVNDRIDLTMHHRQLHALNFWHGSLGYQAHWQQPHVLTHQELHFFQSELFFPRLQFATPAPRLLPSPVSFTSSKLMFSSHSPQQIPIFLIKSCL